MAIKVIIEEIDHKKIVRIEGRVDTASAAILEKKIQSMLENAHLVLVDFSKVNYLSSSGMRVMLSTSKKLKAHGGKLIFFGINHEVMEIIKIAGFERILLIYPNEDAALKSL